MKRLVLGVVLCLLGCARDYERTAIRSWDRMARGEVDAALADYERGVTRPEDRLLRLLDEGILLRSAGRYQESNQKLLVAAKLIEANGYLSLGEQAATLISNERQTTYQGEDFEKILVHVYLSLNFLALGEIESALVEARKVNQILFQMISEGARPYEYNAFSKYLAGVLFEEEGNWNDANVSYREVLKQNQDLMERYPTLGVDLARMLVALGLSEDREWLAKFVSESVLKEGREAWRQRKGSLLFILEVGKTPEKFSSKETHRIGGRDGALSDVLIPVALYEKRPTDIRRARLAREGQAETITTATLHSIEATAFAHLNDRMSRVVAKALLTASVKTGIGVAVGKATGSSDLGILTSLLLFAASEADTRSWLLLPGELQVARLYLPPGAHRIGVDFLRANGEVATTETIDVTIKPRRTTFVQRRVYE